MPRFFVKLFSPLSANCFPSAHAVLRPHAREQPMELWWGLFHNASCCEMADPLFSRPTSLWARVPAVSTLKKHTSLPGYIFLAFLQTPEATVTIPALSLSHCYRPCTPLFAPFTNQPGWRRSCRCTARKHAAATIIALIACFFCWAEISSGATKLLLKPPKNLQVKMAGCVLKKIHKKKRHSGVRSPLRMPIHCRMAHTCMLAPPLK